MVRWRKHAGFVLIDRVLHLCQLDISSAASALEWSGLSWSRRTTLGVAGAGCCHSNEQLVAAGIVLDSATRGPE